MRTGSSSAASRATRAAACAGFLEATRTSRIGRTAHTARTWSGACPPAPIIASTPASGEASRSVATPDAAPVRSAVSVAPSMSASGVPVSPSNQITTACTAGRPRPGFPPRTVTAFRTVPIPCRSAASIASARPPSRASRMGCSMPPEEPAMNPSRTASMAARTGTSSRSRSGEMTSTACQSPSVPGSRPAPRDRSGANPAVPAPQMSPTVKPSGNGSSGSRT